MPSSCLPVATIDLNKTAQVGMTTRARRRRSMSKYSSASNYSGDAYSAGPSQAY